MMTLSGFAFMLLTTQAIVQFTFIGIMISELFNPKRKDKLTTIWLALILFFWLFFVGISEYGLVLGEINILLSWFALISAAIALTLFAIIIIKNFKLINKILALPTALVATTMFIVALIDRYNYHPTTTLPMILAVLFVAIFGSLVFIDILIKTSGRKRK